MTAVVVAAGVDNAVGLGLGAALVVYLLVALLRPERF